MSTKEESGFKDHFSGHAADYARFRPHYPAALFEYLGSIAPSRQLAWDCATGNGQAALELAKVFETVIATDASEKQILNATQNERVEYRKAAAEASGLPDKSVDIVTVAQALHWFDIPAFFTEARRVLKPGGVIAVWSYDLLKVSPEMDRILFSFYKNIVGPYWPPERAMVEDGYRGIEFPFNEIKAPAFEMQATWPFFDLIGYLRTWSATQRYIKENGVDPVDQLSNVLGGSWGPPFRAREITWPVDLRVGTSDPV